MMETGKIFPGRGRVGREVGGVGGGQRERERERESKRERE